MFNMYAWKKAEVLLAFTCSDNNVSKTESSDEAIRDCTFKTDEGQGEVKLGQFFRTGGHMT